MLLLLFESLVKQFKVIFQSNLLSCELCRYLQKTSLPCSRHLYCQILVLDSPEEIPFPFENLFEFAPSSWQPVISVYQLKSSRCKRFVTIRTLYGFSFMNKQFIKVFPHLPFFERQPIRYVQNQFHESNVRM